MIFKKTGYDLSILFEIDLNSINKLMDLSIVIW